MSKQLPISRRRFLLGAGASALAALLAACSDRPVASTTPSPTAPPVVGPRPPLPSATASPTATATATAPPTRPLSLGEPPDTAQQSPLDSPLATPTEPPPPTPTPTPPPTPFPAGPPTKLGLFVAWYHPQIMDLIATRNVAVLKTTEFDPAFLADVKARSPETLIVGRVTLGQLDLNRADMAAEARRAVDAVLPIALDERRAGLVDAWEGFNEPVPGDEAQMRKAGRAGGRAHATPGRKGSPRRGGQFRHRAAAPGVVAGLPPGAGSGPGSRRLPGPARVLGADHLVSHQPANPSTLAPTLPTRAG